MSKVSVALHELAHGVAEVVALSLVAPTKLQEGTINLSVDDDGRNGEAVYVPSKLSEVDERSNGYVLQKVAALSAAAPIILENTNTFAAMVRNQNYDQSDRLSDQDLYVLRSVNLDPALLQSVMLMSWSIRRSLGTNYHKIGTILARDGTVSITPLGLVPRKRIETAREMLPYLQTAVANNDGLASAYSDWSARHDH
ncbi:hypothetical protein [Pseudooceanicola sp. LIPI14-2-Ac024]|uniref:hypothetical protein n=1 Tax=Pseudooceanicola sp. LIPI14-2-Ac024 TaxID=3344875 RepID=UPI0035CF3BEF